MKKKTKKKATRPTGKKTTKRTATRTAKTSRTRAGGTRKFDQRARRRLLDDAEKEGRLLRLRELRRDLDILQRDLPSFSQVSAARIESRTDVLLSTLIRYVEDLGLTLEITARKGSAKPISIFRSGKTRKR